MRLQPSTGGDFSLPIKYNVHQPRKVTAQQLLTHKLLTNAHIRSGGNDVTDFRRDHHSVSGLIVNSPESTCQCYQSLSHNFTLNGGCCHGD